MMKKYLFLALICISCICFFGTDAFANQVDLVLTDETTVLNTFTTIQECADVISAGQTCLVYPGTYFESVSVKNSGAINSPIQFKSTELHKAIIDGSEPLTNWARCLSADECGGNEHWQNIYYTNTTKTPVYLTTAPPLFLNLIQNNNPLKPAQNPASTDLYYQLTMDYYSVQPSSVTTTSLTDYRLENMGGTDLIGKYVYLWVNPNQVTYRKITGYNVETKKISFESAQVYSDKDTLYSIANSSNSNVLDSPGEYYYEETPQPDNSHKIYLWPLNNEDLTASGEVTISTKSSGINLKGKSNIIIDGFKIQKQNGDSFCEGNAIISSTTSNITIRNNEITLRTGECDGIRLIPVTDSLFENNYIHDTGKGKGFSLSGSNITVKNNTIESIGGTGIYFGGASDSQIINNTLINNNGVHANGISVYQGSKNVIVENNRVINSNIALTFEYSENLSVINNIFDGSDNTTNVVASWGGMTGTSYLLNNVILGSNNDYSLHLSTNNGLASYVVKNNIIDGGGFIGSSNNIYTALAWDQTSRYGWYLGQGESVEQDLTKIFVDQKNGDYSLSDNSPAINAGANLLGLVDYDIQGNSRPQGSGWDIGAYEFIESAIPSTQNPICLAHTERYSELAQIQEQISKWFSGENSLKDLLIKVKLYLYC